VISPPNLSLILIMACFWLVYLLVSTQFLKPVGALLDQRDKVLRTARETFAQAKDRLSEAIAGCERDLAQAANEGQKTRAALRAEGEAARRATLDAARQRGQERLAALAGELAKVTDEARAVLRARSGDLARSLAERLVERRIAP
jgi:F0F1-type ATP synthase membrane subunit b/b'